MEVCILATFLYYFGFIIIAGGILLGIMLGIIAQDGFLSFIKVFLTFAFNGMIPGLIFIALAYIIEYQESIQAKLDVLYMERIPAKAEHPETGKGGHPEAGKSKITLEKIQDFKLPKID